MSVGTAVSVLFTVTRFDVEAAPLVEAGVVHLDSEVAGAGGNVDREVVAAAPVLGVGRLLVPGAVVVPVLGREGVAVPFVGLRPGDGGPEPLRGRRVAVPAVETRAPDPKAGIGAPDRDRLHVLGGGDPRDIEAVDSQDPQEMGLNACCQRDLELVVGQRLPVQLVSATARHCDAVHAADVPSVGVRTVDGLGDDVGDVPGQEHDTGEGR